MNPVQRLTDAERLKEIGELLATAALRYLADQPVPPRTDAKQIPADPVAVWDLVADPVEKQVLRFLSVHAAAQPVQIERALKISHVTLARRLVRLREVGLVVVSGKTRNVSYRIASDACQN